MGTIGKAGVTALAALGLLLAPTAGAKEKLTGEARLAKMLEGREAGKPTDCLPNYATNRMTVIDKTAIVYRDGRTLWVNIPNNPQDLDDDEVMVTRTFTSQLCRQDIVTMVDRTGGFFSGTLFLGDFVPYRLPDDKKG